MSNNPFLKTQETYYNRFHALQDDNIPPLYNKTSCKKNTRHNSSTNSFTQYSHQNRDKKIKEVKYIDITNTQAFPYLVDNNSLSAKISTDFKQILVNDVKNQTSTKTTLEPGWVRIQRNNGNIVNTNGQLTPFLIKLQQKQEFESENNINYLMNNSINNMRKIWERYENEYNAMYGERAYQEKFILEPVYGSEYDSESDEEIFEDDDEFN